MLATCDFYLAKRRALAGRDESLRLASGGRCVTLSALHRVRSISELEKVIVARMSITPGKTWCPRKALRMLTQSKKAGCVFCNPTLHFHVIRRPGKCDKAAKRRVLQSRQEAISTLQGLGFWSNSRGELRLKAGVFSSGRAWGFFPFKRETGSGTYLKAVRFTRHVFLDICSLFEQMQGFAPVNRPSIGRLSEGPLIEKCEVLCPRPLLRC